MAVLPSPKFQLYEAMVPSLSVEPEASKLTVSGAVPVRGVALATAVGALLAVADAAVTTTGVLALLVRPLLSFTVRLVL